MRQGISSRKEGQQRIIERKEERERVEKNRRGGCNTERGNKILPSVSRSPILC